MTDIEHALDNAFAKVLGAKFKPTGQAVQLEAGRLPKPAVLGAKGFQKKIAINSRAWRDQVTMKLLDGYGSEDIAIWLGCHVSHVQAEVHRLRRAGMFKAWWGSA